MSLREEFLNNFKILSQTLKENISVYYVTDLGVAYGLTFFELNRLSDKLSSYFLKIFEGKNPYVGVFLKDYFFLPCLILAIWKSGKVFSGIGQQYSKRNTLYFLNQLKIRYLITDASVNEYNGNLKSEFYIQDRKFFIWERHKDDVVINDLKDICYGIMTSGTTNDPKIIHVPWSSILPNAVELSNEFGVKISDCVFLASPCSFDPFFIELFVMLVKGCSLVTVPDVLKLESKNLLKILFFDSKQKNDCTILNDYNKEEENYFSVNIKQLKKPCVTILQMTPSVFKTWTDDEIKDQILSCYSPLKVLVLGGEPFPKNILKLKNPENKTRIFNIYGITEISCWAFLNEVTNWPLNEEVSLGKPLNNIMYKISHDGELFLGSNKRICFMEDESNKDVNVFRNTNDVVKLINDKIYYLRRGNQLVKKYGMKINLTKIEKLFKSEKIKECFCVYNEECKMLGLFFEPVTKRSHVNFTQVPFEDFCKNFGPPQTEELSDIEKPDCLVEIIKVPLNYHGKVNKEILIQYLADVKLLKSNIDLKCVFKNCWIEVLGVKVSDLSTHSFIELGGSSLLALQLMNRLTNAGFIIPEDLISQLLSKESYNSCLENFISAQNKSESITRKRKKFHVPDGNIKFVVRWKFGLGKCIDATPSVFIYQREVRVVVGSHSSKLSCINAHTGREIWTVLLGDRIESGFTTNQDKTKGFIGCYDHFVYCVSLSDGHFLWKYKTGDMIKSTPCVSTDEKILYVASYDTKLHCLSTETGEALHVLKLSDGGIYSSGIVSHSLKTFYIGTLNGTCVAISQVTHRILWKTVLGSPVFASPCLLESKNEVIFSEVLGIVHCLNALHGTEVWTFKATNNIYSSPVAQQSSDVIHILFGCHDEHLYCLKYEEKFQLKWKCQVDSPIFGKPLILSEYSDVYLASTQGFVYLCDLNSGSIRGRLELDGEVFSSVVYFGNRLFVGCRDDNIYCVEIV